jgi:hypothetical protein
MKTSIRLFVSVPLFALLFISLTGAIQPEWKLVSRVAGTVESQAPSSSDWIYIHEAVLLKDGARARTLEDSRAKIMLADQSVITIGSNTTVELARFQLKENARIVELKMLSGRIRASVAKFLKGDSSFEVHTTKAVLAARGTDFYVEVENPETASEGLQQGSDAYTAQAGGPQVYLVVYEGSVRATSGPSVHTFTAGQTGLITPQGNFIINPSTLPRSFTSASGWGHDSDMRNSNGQTGGPGHAGPPPSHVPETQEPTGPGAGQEILTPAGSNVPPQPVFLNPGTTTPSTQSNPSSNSPGTGTIHVNIK